MLLPGPGSRIPGDPLRPASGLTGAQRSRLHGRLVALSPLNQLAHLRPVLEAGLAALGDARLQVPGLSARLLDYLALLARWNRSYNLTAVREPPEMIGKHLLDSLALLPLVDGPLADLGSGPGLPGIPLALAEPRLAVTLVEANGKKARFLREAVRALALGNARVAETRAQVLAEPGRYRCLVARAFGTLAELVRVGGPLLAPDGRLLAMKGRHPADEITALPAGWCAAAVHRLTIPGLEAERHVVVIRRQQTADSRQHGIQ